MVCLRMILCSAESEPRCCCGNYSCTVSRHRPWYGVCLSGAVESSTSVLADTSSLIVLCGLVLALVLVLTLIIITVICFRRYSRRRQKYRSVNRDVPGDLPLKTFPEVGGPTQTYHSGCDLGLSASGSVCLCRDLSGGVGGGDTGSVSSSYRPRSSCRGCEGVMTSHKMAESECQARCSAEVGQ